MPYCPNPECPYRKRFGESAEYRTGTATCSDCGSQLSDHDVLGPVPKTPKKAVSFTLTDLHKRILWTIIPVVFWHILSHVSLPGIDYDFLSRRNQTSDLGFLRFSIFSLGLIPYVNAYILIEMLALFIQPLKRWRQEGTYEGRARLVKAARWMTLLIATYHGYALLTSMAGMEGGQLFVDKSAGFRALLLLTLVTGTFLTVWVADLVSSKGIGHGVSILIVTGYISRIPRDIRRLILFQGDENKVFLFVVLFLAVIGLSALIMVMERSTRRASFRYDDDLRGTVPFKLTSAGAIPALWADSTLSLLLSFIFVLNGGVVDGESVASWIVQNLYPNTAVRAALYSGLVIFFYYLFTAFFYDPREIKRFLADRGAQPDSPSDTDYSALDRSMEHLALVGSLYLIGLSFVDGGFWKWLGVPASLSGLELLTVVCIVYDLIREVDLRRQFVGLVRVAEFHEPWKAGMLQSLLQENAIPSIIRGYHHRALLYFFGPYIEMTVFVPREHAEAAQEIAQQRLRLT